MPLAEKKKLSCYHCRHIKRKCDGEDPCSNCVKRNVKCEYSQHDRRTQRFSLGYIKSLETNNELYEKILGQLLLLKDDNEEVSRVLGSLGSTLLLPTPEPGEELIKLEANFPDEVEGETDYLVDKDGAFGPGSIYHYGSFSRPPPTQDENGHNAVTLEQDYEFVLGVVRSFFQLQLPTSLSYFMDANAIILALEKRELGDVVSPELVYAICSNAFCLNYDQADAYNALAQRKLSEVGFQLTLPLAQAYLLVAVHEISKGQISKGWNLAGVGFRMAYDMGCNVAVDDVAKNRFFMGALLVDQYVCMAVGRRPTIFVQNLPLLKLPLERPVDFMNLQKSVELIELCRPMLRTIYQPAMPGDDTKKHYLMKFNRSKAFNVRLLKWKGHLDAALHWSYKSMSSPNSNLDENNTLKSFYYYMIVFINKPFIHVPREHSSMYIVEEISKELYTIYSRKLEEETHGKIDLDLNGDFSTPFTLTFSQTDPYSWAGMDLCMLTLLCHVLVALITNQPYHYLYLERHFKVFATYLDKKNPRKYRSGDNPIQKLYKKYMDFKATSKHTTPVDKSPAMDVNQLKETLDVVGGLETLPSENFGSENLNSSNSEHNEPLALSSSDISAQIPVPELFLGYKMVPQQQEFARFAPPHDGQLPVAPHMHFSVPPEMSIPPMYHEGLQGAMPYPVNEMAGGVSFVPPPSGLHYEGPSERENLMGDMAGMEYGSFISQNVDPDSRFIADMFSSTGKEFEAERECFNWDGLFKNATTPV